MTTEPKSTAISISDGKVTPISRTPIESISANDWPHLGVSELYHHLSVLEHRRNLAYEMNKQEIVKAMSAAISELQQLIHHKQGTQGNIIT